MEAMATSLSPSMRDAFNRQIRVELASAYTYLGLSAQMANVGLNGFSHWLRRQWEEELAHAMRLFDYLLQRDAEVELFGLEQPSTGISAPLEVFELVLKHEQHVTACINELYSLAVEERDYASQALLQWFVTEQLEEEESAREILDALRLTGDSGASLYLLDRELAKRKPEEEG